MLTSDLLEHRGYTYFPSTSVAYPYAEFFYQKPISDERGIRYFINVIYYSAKHTIPYAWAAEVVINDPHMTFQLHDCDDLNGIEASCNDFWECVAYKSYYQLYEQTY